MDFHASTLLITRANTDVEFIYHSCWSNHKVRSKFKKKRKKLKREDTSHRTGLGWGGENLRILLLESDYLSFKGILIAF